MARKNAKHPGGRPTKMTEATLGKLEEAFAFGASDKEACFYADINPDTLYEYQKKYPKFTERKEALKQLPILKARKTIVDSLSDPKNAQWYLERKAKQEFALRQEVTGADGEQLQGGVLIYKPEKLPNDYDGLNSTSART